MKEGYVNTIEGKRIESCSTLQRNAFTLYKLIEGKVKEIDKATENKGKPIPKLPSSRFYLKIGMQVTARSSTI